MNLKEDLACGSLITPYWKTKITKNSSLLNTRKILEKYSEVTEKQLLWELVKMGLHSETIKYSKEKRFKLRNKEEDLQSKLQELDHKICNGGVFDHQLLEQYEAAKEELKIIHETRGKEAMFKSKVK